MIALRNTQIPSPHPKINLPMLSVRNAGARGRGVFADRRIAAGEELERAPVLVIAPEQSLHLDHGGLHDYYYDWGAGRCAIALGYGSLYNHSYTPNARYEKLIEADVVVFLATRDIEIDEEIVVNYNGDPHDASPLWFEAH